MERVFTKSESLVRHMGIVAGRSGDDRGHKSEQCAELALGNIVSGVFTPVLAKHSKSFSLIDCISVGVDRDAAKL